MTFILLEPCDLPCQAVRSGSCGLWRPLSRRRRADAARWLPRSWRAIRLTDNVTSSEVLARKFRHARNGYNAHPGLPPPMPHKGYTSGETYFSLEDAMVGCFRSTGIFESQWFLFQLVGGSQWPECMSIVGQVLVLLHLFRSLWLQRFHCVEDLIFWCPVFRIREAQLLWLSWK